ncbi:class I adenylate-forming enzyme family protein [Novosphingobium sp. Fuku2-ISO-50]|uniref:class I adenylate-forming enzyme family protein n=1 Tax=Novosphingobium sp. Fuku2-ISO-50 TaxID=1739114 RepID=UPI00076DC5B9|nr:AMP-binding protein [Novosphingobium sp. Fuku2-ISO-50]KUR79173.1 AMP-dependent synthetase [Novosphingobium sp. Fuku2-ISO-50]
MRNIDYFDRQVRLHPNRAVLIANGQTLTYGEVHDLTHRVAGALLTAGLAHQEAVAVMSPNHPAVLVAMLSLWRAGAAWIPVNTRNALADNIAYLTYVRASVLFYHSSYADDARQVQRDVPTIRLMICLDADEGDAPSIDAFMLPAGSPRVPDWGDPTGNGEELTAIIATGGTTGPAKGVRVLNRSWGTMLETIGNIMATDTPPVFLATAPLTHAAGPFTMAGIAMGATVVVLPQFDADAVMDAIVEHRVTHTFLPPTAVYTLLAHPRVRDIDYSSLKYFLLAGSACAPEKLRQMVEVFGPCMCQSYGQTEFHLVATWLSPHVVAAAAAGDHPERLASCGQQTYSVRVELMDDDGALLGPGEVGEIVGRGGIVGGGYFEMPEVSAETWAHGWHHTGDVGRRDEHGFYYIVDRKKDMIVTGGFNVFCTEVEAAVTELSGILECAAIGIPDEKWGEAVTVLIVAAPGAPDAQAIIAHCKERIGSVKAPKHVIFKDALPRTAVGKFDKKAMRAEFWEGQDRGVA